MANAGWEYMVSSLEHCLARHGRELSPPLVATLHLSLWAKVAELRKSGRVIVNMLDSSFFLVGDSVQIYGVAVCVPAVIIFFILAYVIIKERVKRLK